MRRVLVVLVLSLMFNGVYAQDYSDALKDCNLEKDKVYIDWNDPVNSKYAEREFVEGLKQKKLRQFYCQNLIARDKLETDGSVQSKGSFQLANDNEKYLIFSIRMGDLVYEDKLYINIGPRQKLALK